MAQQDNNSTMESRSSKDGDSREQKKKQEMPGIHNDNGIRFKFPKNFRFSFWYFLVLILALSFFNSYLYRGSSTTMIDYNEFKNRISSGEIVRVKISEELLTGYPATTEDTSQNTLTITTSYSTYAVDDPSFITLLDTNGVEYFATPPEKPSLLSTLLSTLFPFIIFFFIWRFAMSRMKGGSGGGGGVLSFNQNKAKIVAEGDTGIRFNDVQGVDESKYELEEVVDFLKRPERYEKVGGKIPKGVLLVGPPGTGKTLLAKAVAGEAGVPFFKMSGADFVEMFVGVGAARVRDLFRQARENSPCIIFIDEIDAIGRSRSQAGLGGNDEREQTLNQLLVEMDGFDARSGVIIIAATNRPEILDQALLRPGRFDRQVLVDKPDVTGRFEILKLHTQKITLDESVDLKKIAQAAAGLSGADLANIANEAALMAVRGDREVVNQSDFEEAIEKSVAGLQRKSRILTPSEREKIAYHEVGHAVSAYLTESASPVSKISIIPRGFGALGYTLQYPTEDKFLMSESELLGTIDTLLGGRAAEEMIFSEVSTGAGNDISRASDLVRQMISEYGMSERYRNITLPSTTKQGLGGAREYSEKAQEYIDSETARVIAERYEIVLNNLKKNREPLEEITKILLEKEVIDGDEFSTLAQTLSK